MAAEQCIKSCRYRPAASVNVCVNHQIGKCNLYFDLGVIVDAWQAGVSVLETDDPLEFLHTTVSKVYTEWCKQHQVTDGFVGGNALLMREFREKWPVWFKPMRRI